MKRFTILLTIWGITTILTTVLSLFYQPQRNDIALLSLSVYALLTILFFTVLWRKITYRDMYRKKRIAAHEENMLTGFRMLFAEEYQGGNTQ